MSSFNRSSSHMCQIYKPLYQSKGQGYHSLSNNSALTTFSFLSLFHSDQNRKNQQEQDEDSSSSSTLIHHVFQNHHKSRPNSLEFTTDSSATYQFRPNFNTKIHQFQKSQKFESFITSFEGSTRFAGNSQNYHHHRARTASTLRFEVRIRYEA